VVINVTLHHRPDTGQAPAIHPDRFWNGDLDTSRFGCSSNGVRVAHLLIAYGSAIAAGNHADGVSRSGSQPWRCSETAAMKR
jgi:hypothetical protein